MKFFKVIGILCLITFVTPLFAEETLLTPQETILGPSLAEDTILTEETLLAEEAATLPEVILSEETILIEETIAEEETQPDYEREFLVSADDFYDDDFDFGDDFFFEASTLVVEAHSFLGNRSFDELFPNLTRSQRAAVMSSTGLRYAFERVGEPQLLPDKNAGIDLISKVMAKNPSHIIEALVLVPYNERELDMLDVYNALGQIQNIKNHSVSLNGREVNIFVETTRLESARNRRVIDDPSPATYLPYAETMFLRFRDAYFGNLFIRGDVSVSMYGITYDMTNFTDVRYALIPLMKAERFAAIIYLEPVTEGIIVYTMSGFYIPGLIANSANLTLNINRRITVLLNWIKDGLKQQDSLAQQDSSLRIAN